MPRLEAPSISCRSMALPAMISVHDSHWLQGTSGSPSRQLSALAMSLARVVLPTPRTPEKSMAWATRLRLSALRKVRTTAC